MSKNTIANRYEVFQHIGQGGMADVFLAIDTILNRQVAIKILRSELCTDAISILRFEREAQAATALSHPNIVEIYDVGEYKGHHYIVMEYVPGKTLKSIIRDRGGLVLEEAIDISKQLCSATQEAHNRGIIHRDIKPQNVIVKSDGSIKILDFGIALAKGSMQITQANNVMGSVHYLAPELAKGEPATVQSDIYALGIVLYEMLTGDVPFKADNAVQVAIMQMRNTMPSPRSINPSIPQSVENIILKATAKDPMMRYRNCAEMLDDLRTCLKPERRNEAKVVLSPSHVDTDIGFDDLPEEEYETKPHKKQTQKHSKKQTSSIRKPNGRVSKPAVQKKEKSHKPALFVLFLMLFALLSAGAYFAATSLGWFKSLSREVEVPNLIGLTVPEARDVCVDNNLVLDTTNVTYTLTDNVEKGKIITVVPDVGSEIERGSRVSVTVSSGIGVTISDYKGRNVSEVIEELGQYQYLKVNTKEEENEDATPGSILRQELLEPGDKFNPATTSEITLVYAAYPTIIIPEEIDHMPIDEAKKVLEELGARVLESDLDYSGLTELEISNLETGVVIKSDPEIGKEYTQREDNFITLFYYGR